MVSLASQIAHDAAKRCQPGTDVHADAAYRRHIATVLLTRVLMRSPNQVESSPQRAVAA